MFWQRCVAFPREAGVGKPFLFRFWYSKTSISISPGTEWSPYRTRVSCCAPEKPREFFGGLPM